MEQEPDVYICFNPHYRLCLHSYGKGFFITRLADKERLANIIIRDVTQVSSIQWDNLTGKFLIFFFKDGTARIYNCFAGGKLISLLRITNPGVTAGIWDRISLLKSPRISFNYDITKSMPLMIKFGRDSRQTYIIPYEAPNSVWRQTKAEDDDSKLFDIHITYQEKNDAFTLMFNGDCTVKLEPGGDPFIRAPIVPKILNISRGVYYIFNSDGSFKSLDIRPLLSCELCLSLIEDIIQMKHLIKYLQDHLELISKDLITPYAEFLKMVCCQQYNSDKLYDQFVSLLLIGDVPLELEEWFIHTLGEKNLKKWKSLGIEAHQKTVQIFTLAFIPAGERLIIIAERLRAHSKALQLLDKHIITELPDITSLIENLQSVLETVLQSIKNLSEQEILLKLFIDWLWDRVFESIDDDYKAKLKLDDKPDIADNLLSYFESQIKQIAQYETVSTFANISYFAAAFHKAGQEIELIFTKHIEPRILKNMIQTHHPSPFSVITMEGSVIEETKLLDVTTSHLLPTIVYVSSHENQKRSENRKFGIGTLQKALPCKMAAQSIMLKLPPNTKTQSIESVKVWETFNSSDFNDNKCSKKDCPGSVNIYVTLKSDYPIDPLMGDSNDPPPVQKKKSTLSYSYFVETNGNLRAIHDDHPLNC